MIELKIYGKPSYPFEMLKSRVNQGLSEAKLNFQLEEKSELKDFIANDIKQIPAVQIGALLFYMDLNNAESSARHIVNQILKKENYGQMKKIITPTDYSLPSENALSYALNLGKDLHAVNQIVHVYKPEVSNLDEYIYVDQNREHSERMKFEKYMDAINDNWLDSMGSEQSMDSSFEIGYPGEVLLDMSDNSNQLIVMGSTGDSGRIKRWFGSVSTEVSKKANCPVLVVPPKAEYKRFKNIVYLCDDLDIDGYAINNLKFVFNAQEPHIHGIHIDDGKKYNFDALKSAWSAFYPETKLSFKNIQDISIDFFQNYCKEEAIDLIVIQRPKRDFLEDLFHKSLTKKLVIHTDTPLLILHSNDKI